MSCIRRAVLLGFAKSALCHVTEYVCAHILIQLCLKFFLFLSSWTSLLVPVYMLLRNLNDSQERVLFPNTRKSVYSIVLILQLTSTLHQCNARIGLKFDSCRCAVQPSVDWLEIKQTQHITGNFTVKTQIYQSIKFNSNQCYPPLNMVNPPSKWSLAPFDSGSLRFSTTAVHGGVSWPARRRTISTV